MTEAIPISATALVPLTAFPTLGILKMPAAAAPYANHLIFLFMGGFLIAIAMERWELHRRVALRIISAVGTGPHRIILGFMISTAFLSMWISNTATTAMMLPIALAVAEIFRPPGENRYPFGTALMLGIAYAASIGGVATLIGTPPNAVLAAAASEILHREIGFLQWMAVGVPITVVFLPTAWFLLTWVLYPTGTLAGNAGEILRREREALGPLSRGEKIVGTVFVLTALSWILRAPKSFGTHTIWGIQSVAPWVDDSTIAMTAALLLFLLPVDWKRGIFVLNWESARRIPWGVLTLFGGGLSLARAMDRSGLAAWIGHAVSGLHWLPPVVIFASVAALFIALTEVTSNTATSTMAMPVMAGAAAGLGLDPLTLMVAAGLASSMAFMLPVATPPNAIVFGSHYITIPQMVRAGLVLNVIAITLISVVCTFLVGSLLGT